MESLRSIDALRLIEVAFLVSTMWVIFSCALGVASWRLQRPCRVWIPRWVRVSLASVTALLFTARPVGAAESSPSTTVDGSNGERGPEPKDVLLVGSGAANALFVGYQVRRSLARVRSERLGGLANSASVGQDPAVVIEGNGKIAVPNRDWRILVRVLGPPSVETRSGETVTFTKGKAQELLVWMAEHRRTSTRSAARTALWDGNVQHSTFSNVVSDVRRTLNAHVQLGDEEWIPRTFTDDLPLHADVVTDADLLEASAQRFVKNPKAHVADLREKLSMVGNLPFWGANYAWADAEGITTSHVIKVVRAAVLLGEHAIDVGDTELLFMATEHGLRVLPGHEELVSLRMKGHAKVGNRAAIKLEWESYARAIEADSWAGALPSPEVERLARELWVPS